MKRALLGLVVFAIAAWLGARSAAHGDAAPQPTAAIAARADVAPRSTLIYPPRPGGLHMQHDSAGHRALPCQTCHVSANASTRSADDLLPQESACVACHAERTDRAHITKDNCGLCHVGFDPAHGSVLADVRGPTPRLTFSHARHVNAQLACASCHAPDAKGEPTLPSMQACTSCHAGKRDLRCTSCHLSTPAGLVATKFPEGKLIPRSSFLGMAHDADFIVRHRWLAADEGSTCSSCHVESECSACHDGERRPKSIHDNDYLTLHAQDARRSATRCQSCHTTQSFCLPCHARLGVSPVSAPDVISPRRFHPPNGIWVRGPVQHAREAQRSLESCISCHAERDCVACHGAKGIGAGLLSPHPSDFAAQCGARLAQNPRPCIACHGSIDALRMRCR